MQQLGVEVVQDEWVCLQSATARAHSEQKIQAVWDTEMYWSREEESVS